MVGRSCLVALALLVTLGCAGVGPASARVGRSIAGVSFDGADPSRSTTRFAAPDGVVDLSEPPRVVDAPSSAAIGQPRVRGFAPAVLLAATEVRSWVPEDHDGETLELELRNACALDLAYEFVAGEDPSSDAANRRTLVGHGVELLLVAEGQWLHLWDGDRWLGSAMTTAARGRMEIAADCERLDVEIDLDRGDTTGFAIRWELDAAAPATPPATSTAELELRVEDQDQPEPWGPPDHEQLIELRLANFCAEPIDYAFAPERSEAPERTASLAGHSERRVAIPAGWWLRYRALDDSWRGGATTSLDGGVMWIDEGCVDFGVADGREVGP